VIGKNVFIRDLRKLLFLCHVRKHIFEAESKSTPDTEFAGSFISGFPASRTASSTLMLLINYSV
jgi:hypothetical protein